MSQIQVVLGRKKKLSVGAFAEEKLSDDRLQMIGGNGRRGFEREGGLEQFSRGVVEPDNLRCGGFAISSDKFLPPMLKRRRAEKLAIDVIDDPPLISLI